MKTLFITIGISGSGKSTWAKKSGYPIVSSDEIRKELTNDINNQSRNKDVFELVDKRLIEYAKSNDSNDVVLDATNCNILYLKPLYDEFSKMYHITFVVFDTNIDTCFKRISERKDGAIVPYSALCKQQINLYDVLCSNLLNTVDTIAYKK